MSQGKNDTNDATGGDEPTPAEAREAEALRRALAGERPESEPPQEALETAALLRYARSAGHLDPARREDLRGRLRSALPGRRRRRWLWALAPLPVVAAAAVLMTVPLSSRQSAAPVSVAPSPPPSPPSPLPLPSPSLLEAQAAAARGDRQALATLDLEMRAYRKAMLDRLLERGGGQRR
jgi:hypothetical protein